MFLFHKCSRVWLTYSRCPLMTKICSDPRRKPLIALCQIFWDVEISTMKIVVQIFAEIKRCIQQLTFQRDVLARDPKVGNIMLQHDDIRRLERQKEDVSIDDVILLLALGNKSGFQKKRLISSKKDLTSNWRWDIPFRNNSYDFISIHTKVCSCDWSNIFKLSSRTENQFQLSVLERR